MRRNLFDILLSNHNFVTSGVLKRIPLWVWILMIVNAIMYISLHLVYFTVLKVDLKALYWKVLAVKSKSALKFGDFVTIFQNNFSSVDISYQCVNIKDIF